MRVYALTLACLIVLTGAPSLIAQDAAGPTDGLIGDTAARKFDDPDFSFSFTTPLGMRLLPDLERSALIGQALPNQPRTDSKTQRLEHSFLWQDTTGPSGDGRQILLMLMDESQWVGTGDFQRWLEAGGVTIIEQEEVSRPVGPGLLIHMEFASPVDLRPMRGLCLYIPRLKRYCLLRLFCDADAWERNEPAFRQTIESIRFREPVSIPPPTEMLGDSGDAGAGSPWLRLEVLGSLVLAAVVVMAMATGTRAKA